MGKSIRYGIAGFALGAAFIGLQAGWAAPPAQLATLAQGEWQLREIDGSNTRSICVADPSVLLQLQQPGQACSRFVLDSEGNRLTVHYTCGGRGHGRSILTVRSARSIKLEMQGIVTGAPFAVDYDGRFVGPCPR